jgi:hypothetical protein
MRMLARPLLSPILHDEALTRYLSDPEARLLVEWLVEEAEQLTADDGVEDTVRRLCRRARAISRFVSLWCYQSARAAAIQLAACERFDWPLPTGAADPCDLMQHILGWESKRLRPHA